MPILTRINNTLKLFIPPILIKGARFVKNLFKRPDLYSIGFHRLEYAPDGWQTKLKNNKNKTKKYKKNQSKSRKKLGSGNVLKRGHKNEKMTMQKNKKKQLLS